MSEEALTNLNTIVTQNWFTVMHPIHILYRVTWDDALELCILVDIDGLHLRLQVSRQRSYRFPSIEKIYIKIIRILGFSILLFHLKMHQNSTDSICIVDTYQLLWGRPGSSPPRQCYSPSKGIFRCHPISPTNKLQRSINCISLHYTEILKLEKLENYVVMEL